ncbi:hypothetical protein [Streptomyces noursei]|uniref:hypothetical protein n=1 Tax=Streptomyces noursei TaxID=1971 RepID=UPI001679D42F|nr:hypothetical protein [Streptomyces noursei]MCZ1015632.1 hypothetical protein [Streptomyces noursei]GGW89605.1 hypothetical protein GCM10010341_08060 [Streptomyces noursei]
MTWEYDVITCANPSTIPEEHDTGCTWDQEPIPFGADWKAAYRSAAHRVHAHVLIRNTRSGRSAVTFKSIVGGGLCETCGRSRGPAYNMLGLGLRYVCPDCIDSFYRDACSRAKAMGQYRPEPYEPALAKVEP